MNTQDNELVSIKNLDYTIRKKEILKEINLEITKGDKIGVVGPNGAGKSTLLKIISGSIYPTRGNVKKHNIPLRSMGTHLTDELPLFLSGKDYLNNCGILKSMDEKLLKIAIQQIGIKLEMTYLDRKIKSYSQGMRKRLALAGTLIHSPSFILFDEPTNFLDSRGEELFLEYLAEKKNTTYIITSHDINQLYTICNKIVRIENGKIVESVRIKSSEKMYVIYVDKFVEGLQIQTEKNNFFRVVPKNDINQMLLKLISEGLLILDIKIINQRVFK